MWKVLRVRRAIYGTEAKIVRFAVLVKPGVLDAYP